MVRPLEPDRLPAGASEPNGTAMIRVEELSKSYRSGDATVPVLSNMSLSVLRGELVAIMGASGSGKSTLLNVLGILDDYDTGAYYLDGELIRNPGEPAASRYRNRFIGFVFQSYNLISFKTALENVALPLHYQHVPRRERDRLAAQYLERVGLAHRAGHPATQLSGGERQRVAVARALITRPKVLLADEPTGALDSVAAHRLMDLFREINAEGMTIVIVTHEQAIAERASRIISVRDGKVLSGEDRLA